ncbi:MAG: GNAT family N-acetyltransferase [Chloroflexota bacterium]|nr:GNAT family N-acetyltransferase [Chloroflexota bacterium]
MDLVLISAELLDALIAGDRETARTLADFSMPEEFPGDAMELVSLRRRQLQEHPDRSPWLLRAVALRAPPRPMVGYANFHGPPGVNDVAAPAAAEIGYTVFPEHRGRGYATEAALAMMEWARLEHGVRHFVSGIAPDNAPSLRVIEKLGFAPTGHVVEGELIFELMH